MSHIQFLSRLKNADLHAISAESIIKNELNITYLTRLRRFFLWEIAALNYTETQLKSELITIAKSSYFLVNPNKEEMDWNISNWLEKTSHSVVLKVENKHLSSQDDIKRKIQSFYSMDLDSIKKYTIWRLEFNQSVPEEKWRSEIVHLSSSNTGFLVHPITEKMDVLHA